ncbi:MAG: SDR family oxidoreductase [Acidobacteria bacterium]|nr:SDR family oxidoreductase [Acidobacteriota bacterium]MDW7984609.1 SDR family oxidoreductase [Acidobacteriota bacterium]
MERFMLEGLVVAMLGASGGLAEASLHALAEQGAHLVLMGRRQGVLEERARQVRARWDRAVQVVVGDIQDEETWGRLWAAMVSLPGRPFGWVCLVGDPGRLSPDQWSVPKLAQLFAVNAAAPLLALRDWGHRMKAAGYGGNAVLFASMQAVHPIEDSLPYALGKAALVYGARILAKEFGTPPPVRVNVIAPGVTEAGMALASIVRGKYRPYVERGVIPRYGRPEDVARAVVFLMTPDLYMTGQVLLLDGGLTLRRDLR